MKRHWTKPYHGVQHCGELGDQLRATVTEHLLFSEVAFWTRGQGFSPPTATYKTVEAARAAGEHWIATGELPAEAKGGS